MPTQADSPAWTGKEAFVACQDPRTHSGVAGPQPMPFTGAGDLIGMSLPAAGEGARHVADTTRSQPRACRRRWRRTTAIARPPAWVWFRRICSGWAPLPGGRSMVSGMTGSIPWPGLTGCRDQRPRQTPSCPTRPARKSVFGRRQGGDSDRPEATCADRRVFLPRASTPSPVDGHPGARVDRGVDAAQATARISLHRHKFHAQGSDPTLAPARSTRVTRSVSRDRRRPITRTDGPGRDALRSTWCPSAVRGQRPPRSEAGGRGGAFGGRTGGEVGAPVRGI